MRNARLTRQLPGLLWLQVYQFASLSRSETLDKLATDFEGFIEVDCI